MPNSGSAPMGQSKLRSIFDLIEMHEHLGDPGPQLTFEAEKELLEEVLLLRRLINREKGYNLPIPVSVYGTPLPETFSAAEHGNPYLEVPGMVREAEAWNQAVSWIEESHRPLSDSEDEEAPRPSLEDVVKVYNKTVIGNLPGPELPPGEPTNAELDQHEQGLTVRQRPHPYHNPPAEEPKGSAIHDRARQFLEANPEEAAYWRRMHNRTSEDIIQQGPVPVEVQIKSALWELRKRRAAGATDEEAVAALFEANSVEELGQLMRFFQDKEPKSMSTIPQSGMSSWGDNPGSSEPKPHGLVTDSEGRTTDSEGHPHFWGSEADEEAAAELEAVKADADEAYAIASEEAEQTSCGEVDASADDFTNPDREDHVPCEGCESPGFAAMRDYLQQMYREAQESESDPIDEHFYWASRNMMAHYLGGESGEARPYGPGSKAHKDAAALAKHGSSSSTKVNEEPTPKREGDSIDSVMDALKEASQDDYASVPITVARMVHYVSYGTPGGEYGSECRAAAVSGVRANDFYPQLADLVVLNPTGLFFNSKSLQSEAEYLGGTWHYPMQCRNNGITRDSRE